MEQRRLSAVVLAAGEGTRMHSERPKPLHLLCGRPMILHVLDAMAEVDVTRVVVVVVGTGRSGSPRRWCSTRRSAMQIEFVEQETQSGTGDALAVGLTGLPDDDDEEEDVVVLPGDTPLLRPQTLAALVRYHRAGDAGATLLTAEVRGPEGLRPVVHGKDDVVCRVVEEVDATDEEQVHHRGQHLDLLLPPEHPGARPAPVDARQRAGRVLPHRCRERALQRGLPGAVTGPARPDGGRRRQRSGAAGGGRSRAARSDQRALDAPGRDDVGSRAHVRRRRGASWRPTCRSSPA